MNFGERLLNGRRAPIKRTIVHHEDLVSIITNRIPDGAQGRQDMILGIPVHEDE
jgi:hypothetical protein